MNSDLPKQYLTIQGRTVLEHTVLRLIAHPEVAGVVVVLHPTDTLFATLVIPSDRPVVTVRGGAERSDSVLNALRYLKALDSPPGWVLIHDAARPCLMREDLDRLLTVGREQNDGALLACPCRDTMKRTDVSGRIAATVDRSSLWHAQTPQLFLLDALIEAHEALLRGRIPMTDDAMAMEYLGLHPLVVPGSELNIKVTRPDDLILARAILAHQRMTLDAGL